MKPCPICGGAVKQPKTGRPRLYDKRACRDQAWRSGTAKETRLAKDAALRDEIARSMRRAIA